MKPIIFSTPMVQAILEGRKTQTRRIVKPQPPQFVDYFEKRGDGFKAYMVPGEPCDYPLVKPKYQPGDILWVRETFCEVPYEHNHVPIKGGYITIPKYAYKADSERDYTGIWKPSIHMPREAARIFLQVTNVRVERLQDITEEDAIAEGMSKTLVDGVTFISAKGKFHALWDTLYAKRGHPWENNPWVWVYEFMRIE
jgi:hypothetical protein